MDTTPTETRPRSKATHLVLWMAQVLLAFMFGFSGYMKAGMPIALLHESFTWTRDVPDALLRFIGVMELLGAAGAILPALTRIKPLLTPLAAAALALVVVLATGFHLVRGEVAQIGMPVFLAALALFVAWGRYRKYPIAPR